ncbi:uncharacterized protein Tco025E_04525 [Trypanosoma conorhini]|uniref:Transmembrane protein n=1 Tax=Trypanosoma conorhini TaxID=83891 RepID=A0A3R7S0B0_9TRYP|nr:uncharacterized protein Tco025E_04525 [Trypanosoma conorhini]RNF18379.1 hypothetical protein Tco025E_04525 [Trypanosoma conorhini]
MSAHSGFSGAGRVGSSYHSIKGYSGAGLPGNPLVDGHKSDDPYVVEQQRLQAIMRNPSLRIESDGSAVYDPNYLPKHKKIISMAPYDGREEYDPVEPLFWLTCASVVGLGAFIVFVIVCVMRLPFDVMWGSPIYAAAGSCAGFLFLGLFLFYALSSKDERSFGRLLDGLIGALPFLLLGALVGYMYSGFVIMMVQLVNDDRASLHMLWWFAIFSAVPPFLLLFIPMFVVAMQVQEASAISARIFKGMPMQPPGYIPRTNNIAQYIFSALRRFIVGFAMGVGLAAYYAVTCFALGMLGYGFYRSTEEYYWIPIVVLVPVALLLLLVVGLLLYFAPYALQCILAPWTQPLVAWSPVALRSAYFPRYYTGVTVKQMIRQTNRTTRQAGQLHVRGEYARAEELYNDADAQRAEIEMRGIELRERDHRGWRKLQTQQRSGVVRRNMQKK